LGEVAQNVEKYKKEFYKRFYPNKYAAALKVNSKAVGVFGKFIKSTGSVLKVGAKALEIGGAGQLYYEVLNPSEGPLDDDELRTSKERQLKKYLE